MTDAPADPWADDAASMSDADVDPFADPDEVGGPRGPFIPWPNVDVIAGRLLAVFPKAFDGKAEVSKYTQEKYNAPAERPEWRVDLVVLDGPVPFSYAYRGKVEGTKDEYADMTYTVEALPFFIPNFRVTWANVIGTLNKGHEKGALIGRIRAGYTAKEMRGGKTFADFDAEVAAWEERVKKEGARKAGDAPRARWHLELSRDPAEKALAMDWYRQAHADGYRIEPATIKNAEERNAS